MSIKVGAEFVKWLIFGAEIQKRRLKMRIGIVGLLIALVVAHGSCSRSQGARDQSLRSLVLNEQELKFAGSALRTVLGSNVNSYVSSSNKVCFAAANNECEIYHGKTLRLIIARNLRC
jgi:hypothetical protein